MNKKGFTLVEVIIAVAIFTVVAACVTSILIRISDINRSTKRKQTAAQLCTNIIEGIREYSLYEVLEDLTQPDGSEILFLNGVVKDYRPTEYNSKTAADFNSGFLKGAADIYGDVSETATLHSELKAREKVRALMCGISYGGLTLDVYLEFDIIKKATDIYTDAMTYYLYDLKVSVYNSQVQCLSEGAKLVSMGTSLVNREGEAEADEENEALNVSIGDPILYAISEYLTEKLKLANLNPQVFGRLRLSMGRGQYNTDQYTYTDVYGYACKSYERKALTGQKQWEPGYYRVITFTKETKNSMLQVELYNYLAYTDNSYNTKYIFPDWTNTVINYIEVYLDGDGSDYRKDVVTEVTGYQIVEDNLDGTYTVYTKKGREFTLEQNLTGEELRASKTAF